MIIDRRTFTISLATLAAGTRVGFAQADYPTQPIKFIVPYGAGGSSDVLARQLAEKATQILGQNVLVENKPGASGAIGMQTVATSKPDGYTIGMGGNGSHAANVHLQKSLPYDSIKDFTPICNLAVQPLILVVNKSLNVKTFDEFVKLVKDNPGKYKYGHTGVGVISHIAGEYFVKQAGLDAPAVGYTGGGPMMVDLINGTIAYTIYARAPMQPAIDNGDAIPLATTLPERSPDFFPELPTFIETGYKDFALNAWLAVYGPAGVTAEIVDKLADAYKQALEDPALRAELIKTGSLPDYMDPQELAEFTKSEIERYGVVIKTIGLEPT